VIVWVFGKLLPPVFRKRAEAVSSAITDATNAKAAADAQLRDAESRLANLQKEVAELRALAERKRLPKWSASARPHTAMRRNRCCARAEIEATERAARLELKA